MEVAEKKSHEGESRRTKKEDSKQAKCLPSVVRKRDKEKRVGRKKNKGKIIKGEYAVESRNRERTKKGVRNHY